MKRPRLWFVTYDANGHEWRVYLATHTTCKHLRDFGPNCERVLGLTLHKARRVYIEVAQTLTDVYETVVHELLHCAFRAMGDTHNLDTEELVVEVLSPPLHALLSAVPIVWPPLPKDLIPLLKE